MHKNEIIIFEIQQFFFFIDREIKKLLITKIVL